jgi:hypothetical protein
MYEPNKLDLQDFKFFLFNRELPSGNISPQPWTLTKEQVNWLKDSSWDMGIFADEAFDRDRWMHLMVFSDFLPTPIVEAAMLQALHIFESGYWDRDVQNRLGYLTHRHRQQMPETCGKTLMYSKDLRKRIKWESRTGNATQARTAERLVQVYQQYREQLLQTIWLPTLLPEEEQADFGGAPASLLSILYPNIWTQGVSLMRVRYAKTHGVVSP